MQAMTKAVDAGLFIGKNYMLRLPSSRKRAIMGEPMGQPKRRRAPIEGQELITLAQKLARDAERHAILSASLASQADRLMVAGLRLLDPPPPRPAAAAPKPRAQA
jgi:hypothetical protein